MFSSHLNTKVLAQCKLCYLQTSEHNLEQGIVNHIKPISIQANQNLLSKEQIENNSTRHCTDILLGLVWGWFLGFLLLLFSHSNALHFRLPDFTVLLSSNTRKEILPFWHSFYFTILFTTIYMCWLEEAVFQNTLKYIVETFTYCKF